MVAERALRPCEDCDGLDCMWQSFHLCTADEWTANERLLRRREGACAETRGLRGLVVEGLGEERACPRPPSLNGHGRATRSTLPTSRVCIPSLPPLHPLSSSTSPPPNLPGCRRCSKRISPLSHLLFRNSRADLTVQRSKRTLGHPYTPPEPRLSSCSASPSPSDCLCAALDVFSSQTTTTGCAALTPWFAVDLSPSLRTSSLVRWSPLQPNLLERRQPTAASFIIDHLALPFSTRGLDCIASGFRFRALLFLILPS